MKRFAKYIIAAILLISLFLVLFAYGILRAGRAKYDGDISLSGLNNRVLIERDDYGVPVIIAENRLDVSRALGYTHAQERFFQMDLLRRKSAGELSELVGVKALSIDKENRFHQFRKRARKVLENMSESDIALLESYVEGVNAGLRDLKVKPWEYFLLSTNPKEWVLEDSILVGYIIFQELQDGKGVIDISRGYIHEILGDELYQFLINDNNSLDTTLDANKGLLPKLPAAKSIIKSFMAPTVAVQKSMVEECAKGSNNWAVGGALTESGAAMVACDMHLSLGVPNIWYRNSLVYQEGAQEYRVDGISLPGLPITILGTNQHIAWGLTSSYVNISDIIIVDEEGDRYKTAEGLMDFEKDIEEIYIKGEKEPVKYEVVNTIWGPISKHNYMGKKIAVKWAVHDSDIINFDIIKMERVKSARKAIDLAKKVCIPTLNFVVGDSEGNIGWTFIGFLPKRKGYNGYLPISFADGKAAWLGRLSPEEYPEIYNPSSNIVFTANNRVLAGDQYRYIGNGGYKSPARAYQIQSKLQTINNVKEKDLLDIQMDCGAIYLRRWQDLFIKAMESKNYYIGYPVEDILSLVSNWDGYADSDSESYHIIHNFRDIVVENVLQRIFAPCIAANEDFNYSKIDYEEHVWAIIKEKPEYMLSLEFDSWDEEIASYVIKAYNSCLENDKLLPWGRKNCLNIQHPMSKAVPILGFLLDMPRVPVSGDSNTVKLSRPEQGASERIIVSPGHEESAIFHMPAGQSGTPISPYYKKGHEDWYLGNPSPLIRGVVKHKLVINPC